MRDDPENGSIISPLQIDAVEVPGTDGLIGMTVCPGKDEYSSLGVNPGPWKRDLDLDLQAISDWGARALVSLIEGHEFALLGLAGLPAKVRRARPGAIQTLEQERYVLTLTFP